MEDQNIEGKDRETSALSKKSLRQHIRQRKARHTDEELVALSQPIVEAVLADPRFQEAQTVLLYHSLPDEVYTPGLIAAALRMGKRVLAARGHQQDGDGDQGVSAHHGDGAQRRLPHP